MTIQSVFHHEQHDPGFIPFLIPGPTGWTPVTAAEFARDVRAVAKGLIASGVRPGDRVALMSTTRYEWVLLDYAIWAAGAATVAIYESSAPAQVAWIVEDSGTRFFLAELERHEKTVRESGVDVREVLRIDDGAIAELISRGTTIDDGELAARAVDETSVATLIYTSGTTGRPKGVALTHGNLDAESRTTREALSALLAPGRRTLMFLPLAHVFARAVSVGAFDAGVTVAHSADWSTLPAQFAAFEPDFILSVPRVFEKVYNAAAQRAADAGPAQRTIFSSAVATAVAASRARDEGGGSIALRIRHALFDRLVYGKLRAAMGGHCTAAVSGGGPLGERLGHFFRAAGIPVYEGYGLTETTAAITVNTPDAHRVGSVGHPLDGHEVMIADDGEVLVRGPVVFSGYWHNEEATADAIVDGWFHTGDLGRIDDDGYVFITGRKKEIIVTAAGKNVSPAPLEDRLRAHPLISQCMVVGDARPFVGALITLDDEALAGWAQRNDSADPRRDPQLTVEIQRAVDDANAAVSSAERIKKFSILDEDWTEATGELTPKLSLKRQVVVARHAADIDALYE